MKDGVRLDAKKMKDAIERIQVLEAYLDEVSGGCCRRCLDDWVVHLVRGVGTWTG